MNETLNTDRLLSCLQKSKRSLWAITCGLASSFAFPLCAFAQPVSDGTTGTQVTPNLIINGIPSDRIDGGTQRGNNLFQSFTRFDVANNRGVYFSNPAGITSIFARVTGGTNSNILGRLGVLGSANLFLLNPKGIILSPNASLDVTGSLVLTSADRIYFVDTTTFSAVNPEPASLLTSSIPIGLGFGNNAGNVQSNALESQFAAPLAIVPKNGGDFLVSNGLLTAPSGKIQQGNGNSSVGIILQAPGTAGSNNSIFLNGLGAGGLRLFFSGQFALLFGASNAEGGFGATTITNLISNILVFREAEYLDLADYLKFALLLGNYRENNILITNSCLAKRNAAQGSFVVTGAGGLPYNPYNRFVGEYHVTSIQDLPHIQVKPLLTPGADQRSPSSSWQWQVGDPIVEMRGVTKTASGQIVPVITYADATALGCLPDRGRQP